MDDVKRVGLLGGGVIGGAWAARAVLNGMDAVVCDTDPEAERKVGEVIENARRAYSMLTIAPLPKPGSWRIVRTLEEAADGADFIQESLPEREDLKIRLLAQAEAAMRPGVVIGSSTSGLLPTRLQSGLKHPERFVVGHPFNPVYLMPLVEVCGGEKTSGDTKQKAMAFYRRIGMHPLQVRKEIDGFIADRMMEALWREALWLVNDDVATTEEIDDAIRFGPGLRWAFMGTMLIYRIAGGEPGMRHFMAQFGPSLKWPWTKLMDVPELDDKLLDKLCDQSDAQAGDVSIRDYERLRDSCLVSIIQGLKANDYGAGRTLAEYEKLLWRTQGKSAVITEIKPEPLRLYESRVEPGWLDYNGHMNESRYLQVFSTASDALLALIGADTDYVRRGNSFYTAETHIMHLHEMRANTPFYVTSQVLDADEKRLHVWQTIVRSDVNVVVATGEHMYLHVDAKAGRAAPMLPEVRGKLAPIVAAHANLPRPSKAGRAIAMQRRA
jgi:carnitine 3-dehydrogenase / betainyl-CoA thioesterase